MFSFYNKSNLKILLNENLDKLSKKKKLYSIYLSLNIKYIRLI